MIRRWAASVAVLALAAGCGVPAEDEARQVPVPTPRPASSATPETSGQTTHTLYLVRDGKLAAVTRTASIPPLPDELLRDLFEGPSAAEQGQGLTSALSATEVPEMTVGAGRVSIDLPEAWEGTGRTDDVLAFGQIVCTLTALPGIDSVAFTHGRLPVSVPDGTGALTVGPLNAGSYQSLLR